MMMRGGGGEGHAAGSALKGSVHLLAACVHCGDEQQELDSMCQQLSVSPCLELYISCSACRHSCIGSRRIRQPLIAEGGQTAARLLGCFVKACSQHRGHVTYLCAAKAGLFPPVSATGNNMLAQDRVSLIGCGYGRVLCQSTARQGATGTRT